MPRRETPVDPSPQRSSTNAPRTVRAWTWLLALGGLALMIAVAVDVIAGDGDAQVVALGFVGALLVVGPAFLARMSRVSVGARGPTFELSRGIADLDAPKTARLVDDRGAGLAEAADAYAAAHTVLAGNEHKAARVRLQDHFVEAAAASALVQQYDAAELHRLFTTAPPVLRVLVLGLMQGDPSLADVDTIASAIRESRTANEQYQGLRLAATVGPRFAAAERRRLVAAIEGDPLIPDSADRSYLKTKALTALTRGGDRDAPAGAATATDSGAGRSTARSTAR